MSTTVSMSAPRTKSPRRIPVLAAASALVAAASISVTLAVTNGGSDAASPPASSGAATAAPDRATLYRHGAGIPESGGVIDGQRAAERFHHFR
jgi:hypothetical protein